MLAAPSATKDAFAESARGLSSKDSDTRRWSIVFFASVLGLVVTLGFGGKYLYARAQVRKAARIEAEREAAEKRAALEEEAKRNRPPLYQSIGFFQLELREKEGMKTAGNHMAEMEVVVACDEAEVCDWIKSNPDLTRGSLSSLFVPTEREQILSIAGKKAFREEIRDAVNKLLESRGVKGQVVEVLFPRFILS